MAETTADVRRDIELTRERMSTTIDELEKKLNVAQMVRDHPWPALAVAFGAGVVLAGSGADMKAAVAATTATKSASSKIGSALDDVVANLLNAVSGALYSQVDQLVDEIKTAVAPQVRRATSQPGYGVGPVDVPLAKGPVSAKDTPRAD
jgi:hypothetical protein